MYDSLLSWFMPRKLKRLSQREPILIGGCGRSGTTLLLSILGAHPSVFAIPHETRTFTRWKRDGLGGEVPDTWTRFCWYVLWYRSSRTNTRWCEKTPMNVKHIGRIEKFLNQSFRFIHIIRDGRDVLTSKHPRDPKHYWVPVKRWVNDTKRGLEFREHPCVLTIRYEDLVISFSETIEEICRFLDEHPDKAMYKWYESSNVKKSGAWFNSSQGLHKDPENRWERPEHRERYKEIMNNPEAVELLRELGYM